MSEKEYDRVLHIHTSDHWNVLYQSIHYNPYEATPYAALNELFEEYEVAKTDGVVDFGCGKGRLLFYIHHRFQIRVTGVEVNRQLYEEAMNNREAYMRKKKRTDGVMRFECCPAEQYEVKKEDNRFYFFNPFSIHIFMKVVDNILRSVEGEKRSVDLILYYPTVEYIQFLERQTPFELFKEVTVPGWYERDDNERFLIFRYEH